jgi:hypothetical protein
MPIAKQLIGTKQALQLRAVFSADGYVLKVVVTATELHVSRPGHWLILKHFRDDRYNCILFLRAPGVGTLDTGLSSRVVEVGST